MCAILAVVLVLDPFTPSASLAAEPGDDTPDAVSIPDSYSQEEIATLLLFGQGRAADDHPEVLDYLGFAPGRPMTDPAVVAEVVPLFLESVDDFETRIYDPVVSGLPWRVEEGIKNLVEAWDFFAVEELGLESVDSGAAVSAQSNAVNRVSFASVAVTAGGLYATAGVATFVLAAAAAVFVVGPVAYLDDASERFMEGELSRFERDEVTLEVADALAR